jgi:site-specific DNA-methyltransferase (adenine-specific)
MLNEIIRGNCVDIMREIPDNHIDLTVTSPPYDNLRSYKGYEFDFESIAKELSRVTKQGGVVVWVVCDSVVDGSETGTSFRQALYFKEIGFNLHDTMVYQKNGLTFPCPTRYHHCWEYMFVLSKGKPKTVNLIHDRPNSRGGEKISGTYRDTDNSLKTKSGAKRGKFVKEIGARFNVWKYDNGYMKVTKDKIAYKHPATFPEDLSRDHIISWSNPGDLVLDPMCGAGTTCKMAKLLGRNFIGIDISEEYCQIARERLTYV